jgi:lactoylglutathione lyase
MQFAYTIVYVADVAASLKFFEAAFGLPTRFLHESGSYGELETGATALAFVDHATAHDSVGQDYVVAAGSDDIVLADAYARALQAGAHPVNPPKTKPWGQTVAYVRCPDGTLVELCTPMG